MATKLLADRSPKDPHGSHRRARDRPDVEHGEA